MADPVNPEPVVPVAPVAPVAAAPAPALETPAAPVVAAVEPAADPEPVAPEAKAPTATDKPTILETVGKEKPAESEVKDPAKPVEPAAAAKPEEKPADKAVEAKPPEKPAEPAKPEAPVEVAPVEYKFELPPTLKADDETMGAFTGLLGKVKAPVEIGQELLNLHAASLTKYDEFKTAEQHRMFNDTKAGWEKDIMADPVLGGAGHLTAMGVVARMRDRFVPAEMMEPRKWPDGSPRLSEFEEFARVTGAGSHRVFSRILHAVGRAFDAPEPPPPDIRPPANNGRAPKGNLYSHPSSANMKQS